MTAAQKQTFVGPLQPKAAYLAKRDARKSFTFNGNGWLNMVLAGVVNDHEKLIAHGVHLKVGPKSDLRRLKFETLLAKVQAAINAA